jgi:hypothetical protein
VTASSRNPDVAALIGFVAAEALMTRDRKSAHSEVYGLKAIHGLKEDV